MGCGREEIGEIGTTNIIRQNFNTHCLLDNNRTGVEGAGQSL